METAPVLLELDVVDPACNEVVVETAAGLLELDVLNLVSNEAVVAMKAEVELASTDILVEDWETDVAASKSLELLLL